ncbi:MAG TPA: hypothetical protein VLZ05_03955 [Mycobacterium sp.]|nr:hypothetical protein [Mycobacterium sp.]HUH68091.1 hypothetical protein [Mycobacterium sp.]
MAEDRAARSKETEALRLLTNHRLDTESPFATILLGQPTLAAKMALGTLAALEQRITARRAITGMTSDETASYLRHHLKLVGRSDPLFTDDAIAHIHQAGRGKPRAVNRLALAALIAAGKNLVDDASARSAVTETNNESQPDGLRFGRAASNGVPAAVCGSYTRSTRLDQGLHPVQAEAPKRYQTTCPLGWGEARLGLSHDQSAGVAPQPAARTVRIGAVVGCGNVQYARDAVRQLAMEATVAVRHISEVVIDVLSGAGDPDGDAVVGQKTEAGDEVPVGANSWIGRGVRCVRVI